MATFRICISPYQKKLDGTYGINLRITHHRKNRWISTNMRIIQGDLTRGLKIKNEYLQRKCQQTENACIDICNDLGLEAERMDVDELAKYIKAKLMGIDGFKLDFMQYII
ncbi:MAG: hypothetical protein RR330_02675 [Alistipes sp.]